MKYVKEKGVRIFVIFNVLGFIIIREVDNVIYIFVGFEILVVLIKVYSL